MSPYFANTFRVQSTPCIFIRSWSWSSSEKVEAIVLSATILRALSRESIDHLEYRPHVWYHDTAVGSTDAIVVQFHPNFAGQELQYRLAFKQVRELFERAKSGLQLKHELALRIAKRIEQLPKSGPLQRIAELLGILDEFQITIGTRAQFPWICCTRKHSRSGAPHPGIEIHPRPNQKKHFPQSSGRSCGVERKCVQPIFQNANQPHLPEYVNEIRLGRAARR